MKTFTTRSCLTLFVAIVCLTSCFESLDFEFFGANALVSCSTEEAWTPDRFNTAIQGKWTGISARCVGVDRSTQQGRAYDTTNIDLHFYDNSRVSVTRTGEDTIVYEYRVEVDSVYGLSAPRMFLRVRSNVPQEMFNGYPALCGDVLEVNHLNGDDCRYVLKRQ